MSPDSGISIIVEVLESVSATDLRDAAGYVRVRIPHLVLSTSRPSSQHFDSLAHDNDAQSKSVIETVEVSNDSKGATPNPVVLYGTQSVQKFNTATAYEVRIMLALYRVPEKNIDLVMTMNAPMTGADGDAVTEKEWGTARNAFDTAARSLRIVDYGLFA